MFKYKLKSFMLINSNFKSSAMTSDSIQQVLQCYHIAEGESSSDTGYQKDIYIHLNIHFSILAC